MVEAEPALEAGGQASMGPRLDNRGYAPSKWQLPRQVRQLQWVHGWIPVVMNITGTAATAMTLASMGPRLDNRGYVQGLSLQGLSLQASMGPRLDNRGYGPTADPCWRWTR